MAIPVDGPGYHDCTRIRAVGPNEPIVADDKGYKTSQVPYRMDLMPGAAMLHLGHIMDYGAQSHGENNWRKGTVEDHLNKALVHVFAYLAGDAQDDHLGHFAWRAMAALEIHLGGQPDATKQTVQQLDAHQVEIIKGDQHQIVGVQPGDALAQQVGQLNGERCTV